MPKPLSRKILLKLGLPAILVPGLILAAALGWNWQKELQNQNYYENRRLFPLTATVKEAQDGDTLLLENDLSVRLLGVNAPERGQPLYSEAKNFTASISAGRKVRLEYEKNYQEDKFGRILAYVWLADLTPGVEVAPHLSASLRGSEDPSGSRTTGGGQTPEVLLNELLARAGLAKVTIYKDRRKLIYQDRLLRAEGEARSKNLNLWSAVNKSP